MPYFAFNNTASSFKNERRSLHYSRHASLLYRHLIPKHIRTFIRNTIKSVARYLSQRFSIKHRRLSQLRSLHAEGHNHTIVAVPWGRLVIDVFDTGVSRSLFVKKQYEPTETRFLQKTLKPGSQFLDIGANLGYYTTLGASLTGKNGKVIGIEPDPDTYQLLKENITLNECINVTLLNCALGDRNTTIRLYKSPELNHGDHRVYRPSGGNIGDVAVELRIGDDLLSDCNITSIDVLKIDVQGYEIPVLRGLRKTIEQSTSLTILSEIWPQGLAEAQGSLEEFTNLMKSYSLCPFQLLPNGSCKKTSWNEVLRFGMQISDAPPSGGYFNLVMTQQNNCCNQPF